jgi:hypothetical protein
MVLLVLGYMLRSPTFGWTGAACCVADGRVPVCVVLHLLMYVMSGLTVSVVVC